MKPISTMLFCITAACCFSPAEAEELVVLTYNIHHAEGMDGRVDLDRIVSVIKAAEPDVVCLQEVDRGLPRTGGLDFPALLAEKLGMQVFFEPNYRFDGGEYGNATLSGLSVSGHHNQALPNPVNAEPRGCLTVTVSWQGLSVEVKNTHLGLNGQERLAQAEAIVADLGETPVILAGDMNENLTAPAMQRLTARLKDTLVKGAENPAGTVPAVSPRRRIDYILASPEFGAVSSTIRHDEETRVASDHLPYKTVLRKAAGNDGNLKTSDAMLKDQPCPAR